LLRLRKLPTWLALAICATKMSRPQSAESKPSFHRTSDRWRAES
jgi:hypothetical protein